LAIPFKSFRYRSAVREWNIGIDRWDLKRNTKSSWIHTPIQYVTGSFPYSGQLIWEDPIPKAKTNISFIPYIAGQTASDQMQADSPQGQPDRLPRRVLQSGWSH